MVQMFGGPPPPPPDPEAKRTLHFNILNVNVSRGEDGVDVEVPADTKILNAEIQSPSHMLVGVVRVGLSEEEQAQADAAALAFEQMQEQAENAEAQAGADFLRELDQEAAADAISQALDEGSDDE